MLEYTVKCKCIYSQFSAPYVIDILALTAKYTDDINITELFYLPKNLCLHGSDRQQNHPRDQILFSAATKKDPTLCRHFNTTILENVHDSGHE